MTEPRYLPGCAAGSQASERTVAASPADYAWIVNFNNGNSNWNNRDNDNFVRAVRPGECHDAVPLRDLHAAWLRARQGKKPSAEQFAFDAAWIDGLFELQRRLIAGAWTPAPPTCFIATAPKAREIHAPAFADRVVHHWLIHELERIYEPVFIHDSYANRAGKGTHAAVARLRAFVRQVQSGQGGGYYLQLDVRNFFNRIHRPTLYALLKGRMARAGLPEPTRRAGHALLRHPAGHAGVRDIQQPFPTVTAHGSQGAVVAAFLAQHNTGMTGHRVDKPLSTIVSRGAQQQLVTSHVLKLKGTSRDGQPVDEPLHTIQASGQHYGEVRAFLLKYYGTDQDPRLEHPLHSVTTKDRFGLVTVHGEPYAIVDIGMRMLTPRELFRAQGFPDSYVIDPEHEGKPLTKTAQVRMAGNSVTPPVAKALVAANVVEQQREAA